MTLKRLALLFGLLVALPAYAQESASFSLTEQSFNAAGNPSDGIVLGSASYRITLDAIGDSVQGGKLVSASFRLDGGFVGSFPPPEEVHDLRFIDKDWLAWAPDGSAADYNLYRNGECLWHGISAPPAPDPEIPFPGLEFSYLVTAENLLSEEGTTGFDSAGYERANDSPCP
jgi:hypothetical protein